MRDGVTALVIGVTLGVSVSGFVLTQLDLIRVRHATVYAICQESRTTNSVSEQTCGDIQDQTHTEYLCKQRNNLSTNKCWVEDK